MALKGTLKDFGIADIFQLISHQSKTGILHLQSKDQEVRISFVNGDVVRAESTTRKQKDLLGAMLVRAEVISESQLEQALELQRRTLKRLGDLLVERGWITRGDLREFTHLQTTETLFKLFNWETGTYAFEPEEVTYDPETVEPIRSENVLMEGFRMVDEWPMVRKRISSYEMTFKKVKEWKEPKEPKPSAPPAGGDEVDNAFEGMFGGGEGGGGGGGGGGAERPKGIGRNEEKVFGLLQEDRDVQKLIDLSRLGEFETCKALFNLLNEGYIKVAGKRETVTAKAEKPGGALRHFPWGRVFIQAGIYLFIIGLLLILYRLLEVDALSLLGQAGTRTVQVPVAREVIDRSQSQRLESALEIFRLEFGRYPEKLAELVEVELVSAGDLQFPWRSERAYRRTEGGFELLRPLE